MSLVALGKPLMHQSSLESLFSDTTDVAASQQQDTCVEVLSTGCDEVVGGALLPRRRGRVDYRMRIGDDEGDSELLVDMEDIYNLDEELRYDARGGSERGRGGSHGSKKRVGQRCAKSPHPATSFSYSNSHNGNQGEKRIAHSAMEKLYREQMNQCIELLKTIIPYNVAWKEREGAQLNKNVALHNTVEYFQDLLARRCNIAGDALDGKDECDGMPRRETPPEARDTANLKRIIANLMEENKKLVEDIQQAQRRNLKLSAAALEQSSSLSEQSQRQHTQRMSPLSSQSLLNEAAVYFTCIDPQLLIMSPGSGFYGHRTNKSQCCFDDDPLLFSEEQQLSVEQDAGSKSLSAAKTRATEEVAEIEIKIKKKRGRKPKIRPAVIDAVVEVKVKDSKAPNILCAVPGAKKQRVHAPEQGQDDLSEGDGRPLDFSDLQQEGINFGFSFLGKAGSSSKYSSSEGNDGKKGTKRKFLESDCYDMFVDSGSYGETTTAEVLKIEATTVTTTMIRTNSVGGRISSTESYFPPQTTVPLSSSSLSMMDMSTMSLSTAGGMGMDRSGSMSMSLSASVNPLDGLEALTKDLCLMGGMKGASSGAMAKMEALV